MIRTSIFRGRRLCSSSGMHESSLGLSSHRFMQPCLHTSRGQWAHYLLRWLPAFLSILSWRLRSSLCWEPFPLFLLSLLLLLQPASPPDLPSYWLSLHIFCHFTLLASSFPVFPRPPPHPHALPQLTPGASSTHHFRRSPVCPPWEQMGSSDQSLSSPSSWSSGAIAIWSHCPYRAMWCARC